jgi:hypothetical protein
MAQIDILSPFRNISPGQFISRYSDWILFTLLIFFFWSVVTIALKKRFGDSKAFRFLTTSTALMLAVGTYYMIYKGKLHLSLAGLGMFGTMLILIVIFFILFGLQRNYGMKVSISLPLGFVLFYISIFALTPNIMTNIQHIFPLAKPIMAILFAISLFRLLTAFFRHSKPNLQEIANNFKRIPATVQDEPEINQEIKDDKKERKLLKGKTLNLTKMEIRTIDDIENGLIHLIKVIKENDKNISKDETYQISQILRQISQKENILLGSMPILKKQAEIYKSKHRKDITELERRLHEAINNPLQQNLIRQEIGFQKRMIEVLDFIETYENRIPEFTQTLNQAISKAILKLKSIHPHECLEYLDYARKEIESIKHVLKKQKELEKYVLSLNKKTIKDLKKEKS